MPPLQNNQGISIPIESIQIGSINSNNISNINRISRFVTTSDIFIPNNTESSIFDMSITYIGPSGNRPSITVEDKYDSMRLFKMSFFHKTPMPRFVYNIKIIIFG